MRDGWEQVAYECNGRSANDIAAWLNTCINRGCVLVSMTSPWTGCVIAVFERRKTQKANE